MTPEHVHISRSISKLGADIPSVNLPPILTCRPNAPCAALCYARKGRFRFKRNQDFLNQNLQIWHKHPEHYEMDVFVAAYASKFFRWHSSGDIPDRPYLEMMVRLATALPGTRFLCFTKKYEMVNQFVSELVSEDGLIPANLIIVFSAWGELVPYNPNNFPVAYIRFSHQQTSIPASAFQCPKYCGECVMHGCSCWDLKPCQSVVFDQH